MDFDNGMDEEICDSCGGKHGFDLSDGYYYCKNCYVQLDGFMETYYEPPQCTTNYYAACARRRIKAPRIIPPSIEEEEEEDFSSQLRMTYVTGIQSLLHSQCDILVQKFQVSPLICGIAPVIWLRFVATTRIFDPTWADETIEKTEQEVPESKEVSKRRGEDCNMYGRSMKIIWLRCLKKKVPVSSSLAVCFLACHIAREPILPNDIHKWSVEGDIPYLNAFKEIEKHIPPTSRFDVKDMFEVCTVVEPRELELESGTIAQLIGLQLPPVNFAAIARRYLKQMSLPVEKILPYAISVLEWSMPPDLWLSANKNRSPTRLCVMSILLFAVRSLYNIHGHGIWEKNLSSLKENEAIDSVEILSNLEKVYERYKQDNHDHTKSLAKYLSYCKNVVFAGTGESVEDEELAKKLWDIHNKTAVEDEGSSAGTRAIESEPKPESDCRTMKRIKMNMEENGFYYIPPRKRVQKQEYLHYVRKNKDKNRVHVAHIDYYILLRACTVIAQVSLEDMHAEALAFEKRLSCTETLIDQSLTNIHLT